jgi:hypothetical protein
MRYDGAMLWARWAISEEGQESMLRPAGSIDDIKEFPRYERLWKEIFQIR